MKVRSCPASILVLLFGLSISSQALSKMSEMPSNDGQMTEYEDPDVDPRTEEGARAIRIADEFLYASIEGQVNAWQEAALQARLRQIPNVNIAYSIPNELYKKAREQQSELSDSERVWLLSRGDLVGKALADPHSLSREERYKVMGWPHPDVVRSKVQHATQGAMGEPAELHKKARQALDRGELTSLSNEELKLIANNFNEGGCVMCFMAGQAPGDQEAANLLFDIEGLDIQVLVEVALSLLPKPPALRARQRM